MVRTTDLYPVSRLINAKSGFDSQLPYHLDLGIVRFHAGGRNARYNALSRLPRVPFIFYFVRQVLIRMGPVIKRKPFLPGGLYFFMRDSSIG